MGGSGSKAAAPLWVYLVDTSNVDEAIQVKSVTDPPSTARRLFLDVQKVIQLLLIIKAFRTGQNVYY